MSGQAEKFYTSLPPFLFSHLRAERKGGKTISTFFPTYMAGSIQYTHSVLYCSVVVVGREKWDLAVGGGRWRRI